MKARAAIKAFNASKFFFTVKETATTLKVYLDIKEAIGSFSEESKRE